MSILHQLTDVNRLKKLRFDVFGRQLLVSRTALGWTCWYLGPEGKKRPAPDLVIPANITDMEMILYLGDLCHEWATERHPDVKRLD